MVKNFVGVSVIVLVYLCLLVIAFSPTLYAVWIYVVGRSAKLKKKVWAASCCPRCASI